MVGSARAAENILSPRLAPNPGARTWGTGCTRLTNVMEPLDYIVAIPLFTVGLIWIGYQLWTGKLLTRDLKLDTTRQERPIKYWVTLSIESLTILVLLWTFVRNITK